MKKNPKRQYEENPTRAVNILGGAALGGLTGGLFFGPAGALVVGATFGTLGAVRDLFGTGQPYRLLANQRCPVGMQVQTLIFSKRNFTRAEAIAWARRNRYSVAKVDVTSESFRIRQRPPGRFARDSFRTIPLTSGVQAVIGCPR